MLSATTWRASSGVQAICSQPCPAPPLSWSTMATMAFIPATCAWMALRSSWRQARVRFGGQQLVVHRQAGDQTQPALVGAVEPVDIGLLVHHGGEAGPDDEIGPAAACRVAKLGVDVDQAAVDRLAASQRILHALLARVVRVVGLAPKGVAAKGQVRHQVGVQVGKAPQRGSWLGAPNNHRPAGRAAWAQWK